MPKVIVFSFGKQLNMLRNIKLILSHAVVSISP